MAETEESSPATPGWLLWVRRLLVALAGLAAAALLGLGALDTQIGHRFTADRIASWAPASGLRIEIGRIDGSLYNSSMLRDVTLSDPQGVFARISEVELDWRPFHWFTSGLDIRKLVARRGTLLRIPRFNPGRPNAPILPDLDTRIDRLEIDGLKVAKGVLGEERRVDLLARADIRSDRALLRVHGEAGGGDRLYALLDAMPAKNRFDLKLDYTAPKGGLISGLTGIRSDLRARIAGKGSWKRWDGALLVDHASTHVVALKLANRAGHYGALGLIRPNGLLSGLAKRAMGDVVSLKSEATLKDNVLRGSLILGATALRGKAQGAIDLADNSFDDLRVVATLADPALLGGDTRLEGAQLTARLDGPFRDLSISGKIGARSFAIGSVRADGVTLAGAGGGYDGKRWALPLSLTVARIVTGDPTLDTRLVDVRATAKMGFSGARLASDNLAIDLPGLAARLALRGDLVRGGYGLAGTVQARRLALPNLGLADADAKIVLGFGKAPWFLQANLAGRMVRVDNATLSSLAGTGIRFSGGFSLGGGRPLLVQRALIDASKLQLAVSGQRLADGTATVAGSGRHADYGLFRVDGRFGGEGLRAELVFASPLPAAGLKDVRLALVPIADGFQIDTQGDSALGTFAGVLRLYSRPGEATRLAVDRLEIWKTGVTGDLTLGEGGVSGRLALAGGGLDGMVELAPRGGGQGFDVAIGAEDARFGGERPIAIGTGRLEAKGYVARDRSTVDGNFYGRGIGIGKSYIGQVAVRAVLENGRGKLNGSIAGRRGNPFNLQVTGDIAPGRFAVLAHGNFAGQKLFMPRRGVLLREDEGGWRLEPTQVDFGKGRMIASGRLGGAATEVDLALAGMPLSLVDTLGGDLALGGTASGLVQYRQQRFGLPSGNVKLKLEGLTRSGLVLTSRPVNLALVGDLAASSFEARGVLSDGGARLGQVQARIARLPGDGMLAERLQAGELFAQLRYAGPADALWRLIAVEEFDLTGPLAIAADATGSLADPRIRGSVSSDTLRLRSALTGTDISGLHARGYFSGSRVQLTTLSGKAANGGTVSGTGSVDLSRLGRQGPGLDFRIAAQDASLLARPDMAATVTGPLRIVSDGVTGTIAGRLDIKQANWRLGKAPAVQELPAISTREINTRADVVAARRPRASWRSMIDAAGKNRINVRGIGLDSEWSANLHLRGPTTAPAITGRAELIRGGYDFAGKYFELARGRIAFDGGSPPNPRLDIVAEGQESGLDARITIAGTAFKPDISFSSTPALPEEELLSRLLFGNSITNLSAPEALQLGAALASLHGGGGLDPINKLRSTIGLDRLRVVSPDIATGRETGIAAGKYLGHRLYAEVISDGRGYSATQMEFRVTSWLSLLSSVSTIGRQSLNLRVSKDY